MREKSPLRVLVVSNNPEKRKKITGCFLHQIGRVLPLRYLKKRIVEARGTKSASEKIRKGFVPDIIVVSSEISLEGKERIVSLFEVPPPLFVINPLKIP